jgi:hypothetical protein
LATQRQRSRIVATASVYFAVVFAAGMALGPIRTIWLEPILGRTVAVVCETPFLIGAMILAANWAPRWTKMEGGWISYLAIGFIALVFQQMADLAVGFGLRGMTLMEQMALFATPPGYVYAFNLLVFALAPLAYRLRSGSRI